MASGWTGTRTRRQIPSFFTQTKNTYNFALKCVKNLYRFYGQTVQSPKPHRRSYLAPINFKFLSIAVQLRLPLRFSSLLRCGWSSAPFWHRFCLWQICFVFRFKRHPLGNNPCSNGVLIPSHIILLPTYVKLYPIGHRPLSYRRNCPTLSLGLNPMSRLPPVTTTTTAFRLFFSLYLLAFSSFLGRRSSARPRPAIVFVRSRRDRRWRTHTRARCFTIRRQLSYR